MECENEVDAMAPRSAAAVDGVSRDAQVLGIFGPYPRAQGRSSV